MNDPLITFLNTLDPAFYRLSMFISLNRVTYVKIGYMASEISKGSGRVWGWRGRSSLKEQNKHFDFKVTKDRAPLREFQRKFKEHSLFVQNKRCLHRGDWGVTLWQ